jgi:3-mercaptopyruvate sulfurtransferase SseA
MSAEHEWVDRTKRFTKAELKRRDVTYEELARRLSEMGIEESKASVASKLSRGGFTAAFFLASMKAIGCQAVRVEDV